ncbi:M20 family metallopeptidase [Acidobacteriota bacterium]
MKFNHFFKSRQGDVIKLLRQLVSLESPTLDRGAVNNCTSFCVQELKNAGAQVKRFPQDDVGDFYLAQYPAKFPRSSEKSILVLTHADTVWPVGQIEKMPFYIEGEKVYGPGVLDMKAGLTMIITVLRAFNQLNVIPERRISVFINSSEEIPNTNATNMLKSLAKKSAYAVCLEPAIPGGALKMQRKGRMVIKLSTSGRAAHAGSPDDGINAIEELARQLQAVKKFRTKEISLNIGKIRGGSKVNVVPDEASAWLDIRFWKLLQKEQIMSNLKKLAPNLRGAKVKTTTESYSPPMEITRGSSKFLQHITEIAAEMSITLEAGKTGGGSDASVISNMGIPTIDGLGPDGDAIHAENEHLILPSLMERISLLAEILRQL